MKAAILDRFRDRTAATWAAGPLTFRDRAAVPPRDVRDGPWRIVPGGTAVRRGAHLGSDVVVMPPSYVNIGAWIGDGTMVDSHVLVGSCAQIGARVHLAAGVTIGGVLEPPGLGRSSSRTTRSSGPARVLLDGVLVGRGAVIGAGVTLTGTSRLYDLVRERVLVGTADVPLAVPPGAVVIPGRGPSAARSPQAHGLSVAVALLVKDRDAGTSARVALEDVAPMSASLGSARPPASRPAAGAQRDPPGGPAGRTRPARSRRAVRHAAVRLRPRRRRPAGRGAPCRAARARRPRVRGQGEPRAGDRGPPRRPRPRRRRRVRG